MRIVENIEYARDVAEKSDLPYTRTDNSMRFMDLYLPETELPAPPVVIIHGGGWMSQSRKGAREQSIARDLVNAGFAAASIDYALVDLDRPDRCARLWPLMLLDCKHAVSFLRRAAGEYNLDPDHIGAIGGSAGAHLAAMLAVTAEVPDLEPRTITSNGEPCSGEPTNGGSRNAPNQPSEHGNDRFAVQAVVYLYGVCDIARWIAGSGEQRLGIQAARIMLGGTREERPEAYDLASPIYHLSNPVPPMLLVHGIDDAIIPCSETENFHARLIEAGHQSELILVPGAGHSFDLHPNGTDLEEPVIAFLRKHLSPGV